MASSDATKKDDKPAVAAEQKPAEQTAQKSAALEEDDEFEDFPVDDWDVEETEAAEKNDTQHLWEESWDDDDTNDDFSNQLKEELKKVEAAKRRS